MRQGGYLVTRGLTGSATNLIIRGLIPTIEEEIERAGGNVVRRGRRRKYDKEKDRYYEEYNIYVELLSVNGKDVFEPIINKVQHKINNKNISISVQPTKLSVKSPDIRINVKVVEKK